MVRARVLLTGTEGWAIERVAHTLRSDEVEVCTCEGPDRVAWPCRGVTGTCPLEEAVDAVVTVRAHPLPQPARREMGVTCGLRAGLPLVVVGSTILHPFATFSVGEIDDLDDERMAERVLELIDRRGPASTVGIGARHLER